MLTIGNKMEKRTLQILKFIMKNNGCQVQDVKKFLGISRPLTSAILQSMEELGFIKREFGEGRAISLKITNKGEEVLKNEAKS